MPTATQSTEHFLCQQGFEQVLPGTWGRLHGELTLFVELDDKSEAALAWVWSSVSEQSLSAKVRVSGSGCQRENTAQALDALSSILAEDATQGAEQSIFPPTEEVPGVPASERVSAL